MHIPLWANILHSIAIGYILGSIPFGYILVWLKKRTDVRSHGSGVIGATNVSRVLGKKLGAFVAVLDSLKGIAAFLIVYFFVGKGFLPYFAAFSAIIGHCFPVWLRFKGGKGVSTSFGVAVLLEIVPAILAFVAFVFGVLSSKRISIGSLLAVWCFTGFSFILDLSVHKYFALALAIFITITHRENIKRIIIGEEKPFWE